MGWKRRLRRPLFVVPAAVIAGLLLLYAATGFLLAPYLIERYLPQYVNTRLQGTATVQQVRVNPFFFTIEAHGLTLTDEKGHPVATVERVAANFDPTARLRGTWAFDTVTLESPEVHLVINEEGQLNLAVLARRFASGDHGPEKAPRAAGEGPDILLRHLEVERGIISLTDRRLDEPARARLYRIDFALQDLTTLPDRTGSYRLRGRLPRGGAIAWRGSLALDPIVSSGTVSIDEIHLSTLWRFLRDTVALEEPAGAISAEMQYAFRVTNGAPQLTADKLAVRATGLNLTQKGAAKPLLSLEEIALHGGHLDLAARELRFQEVAAHTGEIAVVRDQAGTLNWLDAFTGRRAATSATGQPGSPPAPWTVQLDTVQLTAVDFRYRDAQRAGAPDIRISGLGGNFSLVSAPGKAGTALRLKDIDAKAAALSVAAEGTVPPLLALKSVKLDGGRFDSRVPELAVASLTAADGSAHVVRSAEGGLNIARAFASPAEPAGSNGSVLRLVVQKAALGSFNLSFADRSAEPAIHYELTGLHATMTDYYSDGSKAIKVNAAAAVKPAGTISAEATIDAAQGQLNGKLKVAGLALGPVTGRLERSMGVALAADGLSGEGSFSLDARSAPALFRYDGRVRVTNAKADNKRTAGTGGPAPLTSQAAAIRAQGRLTVSAGKNIEARYEGTAAVEDIRVGQLAQARSAAGKLALTVASVSAKGTATYNSDGARVHYAGQTVAAGAALTDSLIKEPLIAWKRFAVNDLEFGLNPNTLVIQGATVDQPRAQIIVREDRSLNITNRLRTLTGPPGEKAGTGKPFPMELERVRLDNGIVHFSDQSLVLPFSTVISELSGSVSGFSTRRDRRASVALEGRAAEHGLARAGGAINLLAPTEFMNLTVTFRNVPMPPLSPYVATFAGRTIASGRMALDLHYVIRGGNLVGENKVVLDEFRLGERVKSRSAIDIPLDLAVALLKDSKGIIRADVPVRGDLSKPNFDFGALIGKAIGNLLGGIVTAPFRALGALLGGKHEQNLDKVTFDPGSARLLPPAEESLATLAKTLRDRPQLKLLVQGRYDATRDQKALREQALRREIARRLGERTPPGEAPSPINFGGSATQQALERMLAERAGPAAVEQLLSSDGGRPARTPSADGGEAAARKGRFRLYRAIAERLVELQPLESNALQKLGADRSQAIVDFLQRHGGLAPARLGTLKPAQEGAGAGNEGVTAKLDLEATDGRS